MFTIILLIMAAASAAVTILVKKQKKGTEVLETVIACMLIFNVGVGCIFAFAGHVFAPDLIATRIGWPAGSPFQLEVAAANLAIGTLGFLSLRFHRDFRLAAAIAFALFLFGSALVHIREIFCRGDHAAYNTGPVLLAGDILIPLVLLVLVIIQRKSTPS